MAETSNVLLDPETGLPRRRPVTVDLEALGVPAEPTISTTVPAVAKEPNILAAPVVSAPIPVTSNVLTTPTTVRPFTSAPANMLLADGTPDTHSQYWGQKVGAGKFNVPLDRFAQMAGMVGHAFDPTGPMGILGKDVSNMAAGAYQERMKREYDSPNALLKRRLVEAQIKQAERKDPSTEWHDYKNARVKADPTVDLARVAQDWKKLGHEPKKESWHYIKDAEGNMSGFADGVLKFGTGQGEDVTSQVGYHVTDDKGRVSAFSKTNKPLGVVSGGGTKTAPISLGDKARYSITGEQLNPATGKMQPVKLNSVTGNLEWAESPGQGTMTPKIVKTETPEQRVKNVVATGILPAIEKAFAAKNKKVGPVVTPKKKAEASKFTNIGKDAKGNRMGLNTETNKWENF
jgi:hypothetical protein